MGSRLRLHVLAIAVVLAAVFAPRAHAFDATDTLAAIEQTSQAWGVSHAWIHRVVGCETGWTFNPYAVGDRGTSFGPAQLHRGGGELPRFYAFGYDDPFDPYQAVEFMAREFLAGRASSWSCR